MHIPRSIVTGPDILFPAAYIMGVVVQCLALLRSRPKKWAVIVFLAMILYMAGLMGYAVHSRASGTGSLDIAAVMPVVISFGFVIAFLFVASFLREVVKVISESVVVSITTSYCVLVLERSGSMNPLPLAAAVLAGGIAAVAAVRMVTGREALPRRFKILYYAWFLFVNALLAFEYYEFLPPGFPLAEGSLAPGPESYLSLAVLGMVNVHLVFNGGILYYSFIYSIINRGIRKDLFEQAAALFSDRQMAAREAWKMLALQCPVFLLFLLAPSWSQFYLICLWILLTPLADLALRSVRRRRAVP